MTLGISIGIGVGKIDQAGGILPPLPSFVTNFTRSNMANWLAKRGGQCKLALVGDSTTLGVGGTTSNTDIQDNVRLGGMPAQLTALLNSSGMPANYNISLGYQFSGDADHRLTLGAGWLGTGVASAGGSAIKATAAGVDSSWAMDDFDTADFWYYTANGFGMWEILIDSVSVKTVNSGAAPLSKWTSTEVTTTPGPHTLAVHWLSGGEVDVQGPACRLSGSPTIDIYNLGVGGVTAVTWATNNNWFDQVLTAAIEADLYVINLGINDLVAAGTTPSAYQAAMTTIIQSCQATGASVIICVPTPCNNSLFTAGIAAYITVLEALSVEFDVPLISWYEWLGGVYTASNYWENNVGAFDTEHPNITTYGNQAAVMQMLLQYF